MDMEQQKEWAEAQKIVFGVDLVKAAKKHLKFLAVVDQNRYLYEDHVLERAIYRYNAFWLPLLAKHMVNPSSEGPLVVPLDCEWIWHCHRLNPIRYKLDCQKLYGRILTNHNVISSFQVTSETNKTREVWNKMYPEEPYELDLNRAVPEDVLQNNPQKEMFTTYDLMAGVKRQISFTYQVSRPHMSDELFLQEAEARYKGFLHLVRINQKLGLERFSVPTYDVDLMWHTHQLHPYYYCTDLIKSNGTVLKHDDTDSDRSKGSKLDNGFIETTKQFEEAFGKKYWKAGAMYRGSTPTPVTEVPSEFKYEGKAINLIDDLDSPLQFPAREVMEVFLEFEEIQNLPEEYKDNFRVSFSKKNSDKFFNTKRSLTLLSGSREKQVAFFQCEPTGELLFELHSDSFKMLGSSSLSLAELLGSRSHLSTDKWLSVEPAVSGLENSELILLHVFVSFTPPTPAPQVFHLFHDSKTCVADDDGKVLFNLQMRNNADKDAKKEVHYVTDSGESRLVAQFIGENWVIRGTDGLFAFQINAQNDGQLFELIGNKMVKLFLGRRLDFQPQQNGNQRCEQDFITAVEFSTDHPYGRAIALFDLKLGTVKATDKWIIIPGITIGFLLSHEVNSGGCSAHCSIDCGGSFSSEETFEGGRCVKCLGVNSAKYGDGGLCDGGKSDEVNSARCIGVKCSAKCGGGGLCGGGKSDEVISSLCALCGWPCFGPSAPEITKANRDSVISSLCGPCGWPCIGPSAPEITKTDRDSGYESYDSSAKSHVVPLCHIPCRLDITKTNRDSVYDNNSDFNLPCNNVMCIPGVTKTNRDSVYDSSSELSLPCNNVMCIPGVTKTTLDDFSLLAKMGKSGCGGVACYVPCLIGGSKANLLGNCDDLSFQVELITGGSCGGGKCGGGKCGGGKCGGGCLVKA